MTARDSASSDVNCSIKGFTGSGWRTTECHISAVLSAIISGRGSRSRGDAGEACDGRVGSAARAEFMSPCDNSDSRRAPTKEVLTLRMRANRPRTLGLRRMWTGISLLHVRIGWRLPIGTIATGWVRLSVRERLLRLRVAPLGHITWGRIACTRSVRTCHYSNS